VGQQPMKVFLNHQKHNPLKNSALCKTIFMIQVSIVSDSQHNQCNEAVYLVWNLIGLAQSGASMICSVPVPAPTFKPTEFGSGFLSF
jgi:hypothetical protein